MSSHCEEYTFDGEPVEHDHCDFCGQCLECWFCECDEATWELAYEQRIDRELAGRPQPVKLTGSTP